jgi:hypothetical protein
MMLDTLPQYTRKIKNAQLGLGLIICLSLLCAGVLGKVACANSLTQPLGIEKGFIETDFRPLTQLIRANTATRYDRS